MRRTRRAGGAAPVRAGTNTMAELSPRADTDQGENPCSFDATISATGNAMARPRANPQAASLRPLARTVRTIWRGAAPRARPMANALDRRAKRALVMRWPDLGPTPRRRA